MAAPQPLRARPMPVQLLLDVAFGVRPVAHLGHARRGTDAQLVETVLGVRNDDVSAAEPPEHPRPHKRYRGPALREQISTVHIVRVVKLQLDPVFARSDHESSGPACLYPCRFQRRRSSFQ